MSCDTDILALLKGGPMSTPDICRRLGRSQYRVYTRLRQLEVYGFVTSVRTGTKIGNAIVWRLARC